MGKNVVLVKSFDFAVRIVHLNKYLVSKHKEHVLSKQVIRSGAAIGAFNMHRVRRLHPHKLSIALKEADRLFFEQIEAELIDDTTLKTQAKVNKLDTFKYAFEERFIDKLIDRMDQNQEIFEKIIEDQAFGGLVKELMMKKVYAKLNEGDGQST